MQCIKVSNEDNLYITDDYVVTHNTSTSTLLAYSMMERGMKYMSIPWWKFWQKKANAIAMKRGMTKAKDSIVEQLNAQKTPVTSKEQYQAIATISSQDEEVGKVVANVVEHVGEDGIVTTEGVATLGVEYDVVEGMKVDYPLVSPYFITDTKKLWSILVNTHVLITDKKITHFKQIIPLLKQITKEKEGSEVPRIFIICKDMRDEALLSSIANKNSGNLEISVVKYPEVQGYAEVLEDVAKLTGAKIVSEALGHRLEKVHFSDLGYAQRVISERHHVTITGGAGNIDSHVEDLRAQIEEEEDNTFTKERLAKLTGGVAIVKVGAATQVEQIERLHRVDDALAATRAAVEEGILPGGGVSYIRCKNTLNLDGDEKIGADIVFESIVEPFRTIVENAGENSSKILESVQKYAKHSPNVGYNTVSGKIEDMIEAHVINPTKVDRVALENAVSVASMFLTLEGAVCDIEKQDPPINYNLMDE